MNKACETGEVREVWHEMAGCDHCGTCIRWDLQDNPVFGFAASCPEKGKMQNAEAGAHESAESDGAQESSSLSSSVSRDAGGTMSDKPHAYVEDVDGATCRACGDYPATYLHYVHQQEEIASLTAQVIAAADALAAAPAEPPRWQPIETAPKDGTRVLLLSPKSIQDDDAPQPFYFVDYWVPETLERWEQVSERRKELREEDNSHWSTWELPTHWQPLPSAPVVLRSSEDDHDDERR